MAKRKEIVIPALALTLTAALVALALALVNGVTAEKIKANLAAESQKAAYEVMPQAAGFGVLTGVEHASIAYEGLGDEGEFIGYVFQTTVKGYGGDVEVITGFDPEGSITGVKILSDSETPGLGKRVNEEGFRRQYVGLKEQAVLSKQAQEGEIQAVSNATISSRAVTEAVNTARKAFDQLMEAEK